MDNVNFLECLCSTPNLDGWSTNLKTLCNVIMYEIEIGVVNHGTTFLMYGCQIITFQWDYLVGCHTAAYALLWQPSCCT